MAIEFNISVLMNMAGTLIDFSNSKTYIKLQQSYVNENESTLIF